jgi:hypothetical protein
VCVLRIDIPDERLSSLNVPADKAADELRMLAATFNMTPEELDRETRLA